MKNKYDDIILKYLSGLLDEDEMKSFDAEIEKNTDLKNHFEEFRSKMAEIKDLNPDESNHDYFINLIPKVHEKLDARSGKRISFSLPKTIGYALAVVLIIFVLVQNGGDYEIFDSESVFSTLEKTDNEELNEFVELRYSDTQLYDIIDDIDLDNYSEAINQQMNQNTEVLYNYAEYSYYGLEGISDISETEENEIYKSLIDKKIL
jgi:hypothetical protein